MLLYMDDVRLPYVTPIFRPPETSLGRNFLVLRAFLAFLGLTELPFCQVAFVPISLSIRYSGKLKFFPKDLDISNLMGIN